MVRDAGLEPASLAAKEPKSFAYASFASRADVLTLYTVKRKNQCRIR